MDNFTCKFYPPEGGCPKNISNWIDFDPVLSWGANILIAATIAAMLWWLVWYLFVYRKRPLCEHCMRQESRRQRTTLRGSCNEPLCHYHLVEQRREEAQRKADAEPAYSCPKHGGEMPKALVRLGDDFVVVDVCPEGCQFHDEGETDKLNAHARDQGYHEGHSAGQSSGMVVGMATGMVINQN